MRLVALGAFFLGVKEIVDSYSSEAMVDKVENLPGTENLVVNFNQFSGYLDVQGSRAFGENTKRMHYWFVESMNNPATDPIAFWTNGGPGCSGLIAFFTEQGPFRPNLDGSLSYNSYAWNRASNMVFIESPTGVGFSYSNVSGDFNSNDNSTARDNYNLIHAFFNRFPEYSNNSMYLTSESYGGHYVPTLAKLVVEENKLKTRPHLNLKGIAIGNPYTDEYSGTQAMIETLWGHQLISMPTYNLYQKNCGSSSQSYQCAQLEADLMGGIGNLNPYALDFEVCLHSSLISERSLIQSSQPFLQELSKSRNEQKLWLFNYLYSHLSNEERKLINIPKIQKYEPCEDDYTVKYLANIAVKKAIHVKEDITWTACSNAIKYDTSDLAISTAPIYKYLIEGGYGLDILIYSGDDDSVCSTIGSQKWIWNLGYKSILKWQPYYVNKQTAGYITKFGNNSRLTFLTVHGAGHEVPAYQPAIAYEMWISFLAGDLTILN